MLTQAISDPKVLAVTREFQFSPAMTVPVTARGHILRAIQFVAAESGRHYDAADLALAEDLAGRAASAVDNARLYREAQQAIGLRDEFLSVAAHELKTPVTSLLGFAQLLLRQLQRGDMPDADRLERALKNIQQQSEKLTRLISQLLDISRIQAGRLKLDTERVDLSKLTEDAVEVTRYTTSYHTIRLRNSAAVFIMADACGLNRC